MYYKPGIKVAIRRSAKAAASSQKAIGDSTSIVIKLAIKPITPTIREINQAFVW